MKAFASIKTALLDELVIGEAERIRRGKRIKAEKEAKMKEVRNLRRGEEVPSTSREL